MISGRWFKSERIKLIFADIFSVIGLFTIIIAIVQFFPLLKQISDFLQERDSLIVLMVVSILYSLIKNRPQNEFIFNVNNRDVELAFEIGNIEKINSSYIVPINSEFDMNLDGSVKGSNSVQSMVINKYFAGDTKVLQQRVLKELKSKIYTVQKENGKYKLGTTVRIETDDKKKSFYFVANSYKINEKRVEASEQDLSVVLGGLWSYISNNGVKEHISIPLLGTGHGRIKITREEVYKEIVRSFVASCSGKNYCDRMTIVIRDEDITKYKIDVEQLVEFTKLQTQYADFAKDIGPATGNPID